MKEVIVLRAGLNVFNEKQKDQYVCTTKGYYHPSRNVFISDDINDATRFLRFCEDKVNVRVRRLSLLGLCQKGQIPNQLLGKAKELFYGESGKEGSTDLKSTGELFDIVCKNVLVEPSVKQLEDAEIELTDTQKLQLWSYSQEGIDGLKSFREVAENAEHYSDSKKLQDKVKPNFKHRR